MYPVVQNKFDISVLLRLEHVLGDFDRHAHDHGKFDDGHAIKWRELTHEWWADMPLNDGAKEFHDSVRDMRLGPMALLTAPAKSSDEGAGKGAWLQKNLPELGSHALQFLMSCPAEHVPMLAAPKRILIDAHEKQCADWRQAGGVSVHHDGDFTATRARLCEAVAGIRGVEAFFAPLKCPLIPDIAGW